ncbi:MAG TPA: hypothetical protein VG498_01535 [Terriglobales bacterium]|nr:hypothetical protein [Terriglobales bacterium]
MANEEQERESQERKEETKGTEKFGADSDNPGAEKARLQAHTRENRAGELNPSAPTEATEGPSTNLAHQGADVDVANASRGEPARGESKTNEGTIRKPSAEKHEAA